MSPELTINMEGKIAALRDRAYMFSQIRQYFSEQGVIEVDVPALSSSGAIDTHIDLIPAFYSHNKKCYLHSSPEYRMKRLLSLGIGDIYQLAHVFRDGECSIKHQPEFMMLEWYRVGWSLYELMDETAHIAKLFLGDLKVQKLSYRNAFLHFTGLDSDTCTNLELFNYIQKQGLEPYAPVEQMGRDELLNIILGAFIEPNLGDGQLTLLYGYPASQAALAQTAIIDGHLAAERFEMYYQGIELANGYHELANPTEQRKRFIESNQERLSLGKEPYPLDELFLQALEKKFPDCSGVAVGFDRLMMLRHKAFSIDDVIPFGWESSSPLYCI